MNRNNILEPLLHILVLVILFGFPYTFVNSLDSVNWKMVANRVAVPVALCILFYADYFLLVPKLLFKGRTGLWFQINRNCRGGILSGWTGPVRALSMQSRVPEDSG